MSRELEEFVEEHTGEEGPLEDAFNDKGKITKAGVKAQLMTILNSGWTESEQERDALTRCLALIDAESKASKAVRNAQAVLDRQVLYRYASLTETEVKALVVEDKWFPSIQTAIEGEVQSMTQRLAGRVKELEKRYASTMPALERDVEAFSERVEGHLKKMEGGVGMKAVVARQKSNHLADGSAAIPSGCKQTAVSEHTRRLENSKDRRTRIHHNRLKEHTRQGRRRRVSVLCSISRGRTD